MPRKDATYSNLATKKRVPKFADQGTLLTESFAYKTRLLTLDH